MKFRKEVDLKMIFTSSWRTFTVRESLEKTFEVKYIAKDRQFLFTFLG